MTSIALLDAVLVFLWLGLTAYALLGGADFGAGFWDLLAGGAQGGARQRDVIEHSIGPVWEANHVWLIYVLVILWTALPRAFAPIMSTLYMPLTAAAVGVILRGAGFAFRKAVVEVPTRRLFGATFALSSVITPFFLGAFAGGVASGRVPPGNAAGEPVTSWVNPTSLLGGTLAVAVCAYLAAVFLCRDAERGGHPDLAEGFRRRALVTGAVTGAIALAGIAVLHADAELLFDGLTGKALPVVLASAAAGLGSLGLLARRAYRAARVAAALAVTAVLWGWAVAQYPYALEGRLKLVDAAAPNSVLWALLVTLAVGTVFVVPSLALLFWLTQRGRLAALADEREPAVSGAPGAVEA